MLAAAAILWVTLDADVATPAAGIGRGWTIAVEGRASFRPLFEYPDFKSGALTTGGFRIAHAARAGAVFALTGSAGATYIDSWRPVFDTTAEVSWRERLDVRAGLRHDERLRREGALADFRDPTGRIFVGATALPLHTGRLSAGAGVDYQRALPGLTRLPSGVSASVVVRVRLR